MTDEWREVGKAEFDAFLAARPRLKRDVIFFCEPPLVNYNDFSKGKKWPESMVAKSQEVWGLQYEPTGEVKYWLRSPEQ
jgi:hypothetical protein